MYCGSYTNLKGDNNIILFVKTTSCVESNNIVHKLCPTLRESTRVVSICKYINREKKKADKRDTPMTNPSMGSRPLLLILEIVSNLEMKSIDII